MLSKKLLGTVSLILPKLLPELLSIVKTGEISKDAENTAGFVVLLDLCLF